MSNTMPDRITSAEEANVKRVRKGKVYHDGDYNYFRLYAVTWTRGERVGAYQKWAWEGARQELDAMDFDRRMVAIGYE